MICPKCESNKIVKNGHHRGKQRYKCCECGRQFVDFHTTAGYCFQIKQQCLEMYLNGLGFRAIERITGVHHTTIIS